jgi:Na+-translocating ferredoxin:NAD+ oxidoreductase RnfG subunit
MVSRNAKFTGLTGLALGASILSPVAHFARAEVYLSEDQVAHALFPGIKLVRREIELTDAQIEAIENASGEDVRNKRVVALVGKNKEAVFIDKVIGKHEFITMAAGFAPDGSIRGIEILEYRETYGYQVRNADWRKQFVGKTTASKLKLNSDIKNISGATLSSAHVTTGSKLLLHVYEVLRPTL